MPVPMWGRPGNLPGSTDRREPQRACRAAMPQKLFSAVAARMPSIGTPKQGRQSMSLLEPPVCPAEGADGARHVGAALPAAASPLLSRFLITGFQGHREIEAEQKTQRQTAQKEHQCTKAGARLCQPAGRARSAAAAAAAWGLTSGGYCGAPTSSTTCRAFLISSSMISSSLARAYFLRSCSAGQPASRGRGQAGG